MDQSKVPNKGKNKAMGKGKSVSLSEGSCRRNFVAGETTIKQEDSLTDVFEEGYSKSSGEGYVPAGSSLEEDYSAVGEVIGGDHFDMNAIFHTPLLTLKHKTSTKSVSTRKKTKTDTDYPLHLKAEPHLPDYVPESLTALKCSTDTIELPIRLKYGGKTIKVHCDYQTGSAGENFWKEVANRVKELKILEERRSTLPGGSEIHED